MDHPPKEVDLRRLPRDLRRLGRTARAAGWRIEPTKSHHWRWVSPSGTSTIVASGSPGDPNMPKIIRRLLQRAGLHL